MDEDEKEIWRDVQYRMDAEGFHYCFDGYSSWVLPSTINI